MLRLVNLGIVGGAAIALAAYLAAPSPAGAQTVPDTTPEGMVAFFPLTECPAGWSISASARGRFLMAVTEGSDVGGTVGTALTAGELPTSHTHTFQTSVSLSSHGCYDCFNGGAGWTGANSGSHDVPGSPPGTTGSHETYSYTQLLACEKGPPSTQSQTDNYAQNMVAFYDAAACPQGWELMESDSKPVNGVFAIPFADPGSAIGTVSGTPLTPGSPWTHSHSFKSSISVGSTDLQADSGSGSSSAQDGTYDFSGTTSTETIAFPYLQLLLCKKTAFSSNTLPAGLPQKILMFYAENDCPDGWVVSPSGFNRPLLGLPEGGTPNESVGDETVASPGHDYWHDHGISGSVNVGSQKISVDKGCNIFLCDKGHANSGSVSFSGTTYWDGALPYITLSLCQPDT